MENFMRFVVDHNLWTYQKLIELGVRIFLASNHVVMNVEYDKFILAIRDIDVNQGSIGGLIEMVTTYRDSQIKEKNRSYSYTVIVDNEISEQEKIAELKKLLEKGFDLNTNLTAGFTLLHFAIRKDQPTVAKFLIENGANPHIENCDGCTAYEIAHGHDKLGNPTNQGLINIVKLSKSNVFRPGMNRHTQKEIAAIHKSYNRGYGLKLELGEIFE